MPPPHPHSPSANTLKNTPPTPTRTHQTQTTPTNSDLKSGNLLVADDFTVRVADFGLARAGLPGSGPNAAGAPADVMTGGLGTFQWMAPEVLGHQAYSQKADVYSFGIVAWEAAARRVPSRTP